MKTTGIKLSKAQTDALASKIFNETTEDYKKKLEKSAKYTALVKKKEELSKENQALYVAYNTSSKQINEISNSIIKLKQELVPKLNMSTITQEITLETIQATDIDSLIKKIKAKL